MIHDQSDVRVSFRGLALLTAFSRRHHQSLETIAQTMTSSCRDFETIKDQRPVSTRGGTQILPVLRIPPPGKISGMPGANDAPSCKAESGQSEQGCNLQLRVDIAEQLRKRDVGYKGLTG